LAACLLTASIVPALAKSELPGAETMPLDIFVDLVLVRPLSVIGTALCAGLFIASLPLTVWTEKRFTQSLRTLVIKPGSFTFVRPPGHF
jgi:hypothetical protein